MRDNFHDYIQAALADSNLQKSLDLNTEYRASKRISAFSELQNTDELQNRAREIRKDVIENIDVYKLKFVSKLEENGIRVFMAADGREACDYIQKISREKGAKIVAKSKSLVSEEVGLNRALSNIGVSVIETDLSKYIAQLHAEEGEHVPLPSYTLRREDVASLFQRKLGVDYSTNLEDIFCAARLALKEVFFSCDIGISGVNFGVVDTGTICLVTNEGNGRMVTTLPRVHIALMGVERLVPTLEDLTVFLKLLARSTSGQKQVSYVTMLQGSRWGKEPDGPDERHVIMVDNGRLEMAKSELAEGLFCIRCFACLNVCPVYREIGGAAYGSVYPGPFGSIVSPGLFGIDNFGHLACASTLCGACRDACPVKINIPLLLLRIRNSYRKTNNRSFVLRKAMQIYSWFMLSHVRYSAIQKIAAFASKFFPRRNGWITKLPMPISGWTKTRDFPPFSSNPFRSRVIHNIPKTVDLIMETTGQSKTIRPSYPDEISEKISKFKTELESLGGSFCLCDKNEMNKKIIEHLKALEVSNIIAWKSNNHITKLLEEFRNAGIGILDDFVPYNEPGVRESRYYKLSTAEVGITGAIAGFADTGSIVLPSAEGQSQISSLLPQTHIVILSRDQIFETMEEWLSQGGRRVYENSSNVCIVTGPSCSGDIEITFEKGLHGPREVIVYCPE